MKCCSIFTDDANWKRKDRWKELHLKGMWCISRIEKQLRSSSPTLKRSESTAQVHYKTQTSNSCVYWKRVPCVPNNCLELTGDDLPQLDLVCFWVKSPPVHSPVCTQTGWIPQVCFGCRAINVKLNMKRRAPQQMGWARKTEVYFLDLLQISIKLVLTLTQVHLLFFLPDQI